MDKRILITGANGHLGLRLLRRLGACDPAPRAVCAVVRSERAASAIRELPEQCRPEVRIVDYLNEAEMLRSAEGMDAVVHLVGILKETANARYAEAHESATTAVGRAAEAAGCQRVVYLSILGSTPDSPNACLASKGRAESILLDRAVPASVLRVPMVLGPGEIACFALRAQATAAFVPLIRGGATLEQPIDAENVIDAILAALDRPASESCSFDLAGPESLSHRELVRRAAAILGGSPRILPIPLFLARAAARLAERLMANPPLTPAMLGVLEHDDCIDPEPDCRKLGIKLTPLDETLRRCFEAGGGS